MFDQVITCGSNTTWSKQPALSSRSYGTCELSLRCEPVKIEDSQGFEHLLVSGLIFLKLKTNRFFTQFFNSNI